MAFVCALALVVSGCGATVPETRYYQLRAPERAVVFNPTSRVVLTVEPFAVDTAYRSERIVYRTSPYRLDYYHYHRWSSPPSLQVSDYLRRALAASGSFRAVLGAPSRRAAAVLTGRVIAMEEVDQASDRWLGRIEIELALLLADTRETIWSQHFAEEEDLDERSPEGLARALSKALERIVTVSTPAIHRAALGATAVATNSSAE